MYTANRARSVSIFMRMCSLLTSFEKLIRILIHRVHTLQYNRIECQLHVGSALG